MNRSLVHIVRIVMLCCWPAVAWAGASTFGASMGDIGWRDVLAVVFLSVFSGAVAMLQRMEREAIPTVTARWVLAHMSAALLAGVIAFIGGEIVDLNDWQEALGVIVAAWGGSVYIERLARTLTTLGDGK